MMRSPAMLAVALLLGGCMVGPDYRTASVPPAATAPFAGSPTVQPDLPPRWWRLYEDPILDTLIDEALRRNTDVRVAAANLRRARAVLSEARGALLPQTDTSAQYSRIRQGTASLGTVNGTGTGAGTGAAGANVPDSYTVNSYSVGLDVAYELDLFGGARRGIEAARGDYQASAAALDAARVAIAADTARSYAEACGYAEQAAAARATLALQAQTLDLTQRLESGGRVTLREVEEARTLYEQSRASLASLDAERRATLDALAVLTGRPPTALDPVVATCVRPPRLSRPTPVGDGRALLARRADVRQAERRLAADTARVGVAVADLYPKISLLGSISNASTRAGDLGTSRALSYSFGPLISWSFPIQSAARARVRETKATADASLASFDGTVLTALKEVEQALARLQGETARNQALARAFAAADRAATITRYRFDYGADNFLQRLDVDRSRATASAELARSNTALADAEIDLFRALGGGWEQAPPVAETRFDGQAIPSPGRP